MAGVITALAITAAPAAAGDRGIAKRIRQMTSRRRSGSCSSPTSTASARTSAAADVEANNTMYGPGIANAET